MNPKSHFSFPLSSSKGEGKSSACDFSLYCKNTTLEFVASMWTNDVHMCNASKLLEKKKSTLKKIHSINPCSGWEQHRAGRAGTWPASIKLSEGAVVRAVYKFHGARLLSLYALAGPKEEGDHVLANTPHRVLSQPWGRKGDFQLPASDTEQLLGYLLLG